MCEGMNSQKSAYTDLAADRNGGTITLPAGKLRASSSADILLPVFLITFLDMLCIPGLLVSLSNEHNANFKLDRQLFVLQ